MWLINHQGMVQVMEQEIVVKPGDSDIVRLSILPLKPGLLRITGLEWVLNGQAQGRRLFAAKAPQHRRTGSRYPAMPPVLPILILLFPTKISVPGRSAAIFFSKSYWSSPHTLHSHVACLTH